MARPEGIIDRISEWLPIWNRRRIAYIPIEQIGSVMFHDLVWSIVKYVSGDKMFDGVNDLFEKARQMAVGRQVYQRWDMQSSQAAKNFLSLPHRNLRYSRRRFTVTIETTSQDEKIVDLYTCDIISAEDNISLWQRPWIPPMSVKGYPYEFRVFVENNTVVGVSNYHPQRPLPRNKEHIRNAELCARLTEPITREVARFSADWFFPRHQSTPLMLECGSPHDVSFEYIPYPYAFPCCFAHDAIGKGEDGLIALSPQRGSLPLPEYLVEALAEFNHKRR